MAIIPKKLDKHKLKIKGWFTVPDLICVLAFAIIGAIFALTLSILGIIGQIFIGVGIFAILLMFIMPVNTTMNLRLYQQIFKFFRFSNSQRKFEFEKSNADSRNLICLEEIVPSESTFEDAKIIKTKNINGSVFYTTAFKIRGFDIFNLNEGDGDVKIRNLKNLFMSLEVRSKLIKINAELNLQSNKRYYQNILKRLQRKKEKTRQEKARIVQLQGRVHQFKDENSFLSSENLEAEYYLVLYSKVDPKVGKKELISQINKVISAGQSAGLKIEQINVYDYVNLMLNLVSPASPKISKSTIDQAEFLDDLISYSKVEFKGEYLKIPTNKGNEKMFMSLNVLTDYPNEVSRTWLNSIFNSNASVVVNFMPMQIQNLSKQLSGQISTLRSNINSHSNRDLIGKQKLDNEANVLEQLVAEMAAGDEKLIPTNIITFNYSDKLPVLKATEKEIIKTAKPQNFIYNNLLFEQQEAFKAALTPNDSLLKKYGREIPTKTLAEAFPFDSTDLKDEKGVPLGTSSTGDVIILDLNKTNKEDSTRLNHNSFFIGTSGSGKTTSSKKIINNHLMKGGKVIILDPEREYKNLTTYYSGKWIDAGTGINGRINPLQTLAIIKDIKFKTIEQANEAILKDHLQNLETFFDLLYGTRDDAQDLISHILKGVNLLYKEPKFQLKKEKSILNQPAKWYPTIDNLIEFLINSSNKEEFANKYHHRVIQLLTDDFTNVGSGKYKELYNGASTIGALDNQLTIFDVQALNNKKGAIRASQMALITAFIENEVIHNTMKDEPILVVIDEAHLLINEDNPVALDFVFRLVKMIRKRYGGVMIITQNPQDFIGSPEIAKKTEAIINNTQYSFILKLSPKNIDDVDKMYRSTGGLTQEQKEYIKYAKAGEGLLIINANEKYNFKMIVTHLEEAAMKADVSRLEI